MAKPFFPFEETIIGATGLVMGAIAAAGVQETRNRSLEKPAELECSCNENRQRLNNFDTGHLHTEFTLEVLL
ncbi:hypothetical protein [uncultured Roseibium sp.]|uniref:hypothetical protein n=1 Tax=uncultured Roseibium sp. TaxID=1936171 RepID=UPI0026110645|nr:hypothetical protein [uncultured Roseibium sp.]